MLDFVKISTRTKRNGIIEIYPKFIIKKSKDLMIRGSDFYAIWVEEEGRWSTDEQDAIQMIDEMIEDYRHAHFGEERVDCLFLWDSESKMIDAWHKYCQKQMRDSYHMLDEKLIFSNDETNKEDYSSKRLNYPLEQGDISAWDKMMSVLYSPEERQKIEWAIGSIVSGDSKHIQKFVVLYGAAGTGKSTVLNVIQKLFEGYYSVFDAKALGSSNNSFALEAFKTNPLVAIQHDGDLSKIEDNTRLNSLISHELMTVNEKFKSTYSTRFKAFLFMGTNKPVKITDGRSGLIRRLIDVSPTGDKLSLREYKRLTKQIDFELGHIAYYCRDIYLANPTKYDNYMPISMLGASNDFYNFMEDQYLNFKREDGVSLKSAWEAYNQYCEEAKITYPFSQRVFKEELKNYFHELKERYTTKDGIRVRNYFIGFRTEKFENILDASKDKDEEYVIKFEEIESIFDKDCSECPAQYTKEDGTPLKSWKDVNTKLRHLDTSKLHFVRVPENHIVIDFDIKNDKGEKDFDLNLKEASKWPPTYAELSKSGGGIHLHYIYEGDISKLCSRYNDEIEIKIFKGNASLRRKLTKCNKLPIAKISSGLPIKKEKKTKGMIDLNELKTERQFKGYLVNIIKKCLNKEGDIPSTTSGIDLIYKVLEEAYESGKEYDVSDLRNSVATFAANSTHNANYCLKMVNKMKFRSEDYFGDIPEPKKPIAFYDVEVFKNLFIICWKLAGKGTSVIKLINPAQTEVEALMRYKLIGFNCRRYDNHILYAKYMGYDNEQLYNLSQRIISGDKNAFFRKAYSISYTDVYDFCSEKKSLKKWEIELGIHHQELGWPWDKEIPEKLWQKAADYCANDVLATEAVFEARQADFVAREILADITGMSVNETTNNLSAQFIFGNNKTPQDQFNYRRLGELGTNNKTIMPELTTPSDKWVEVYGDCLDGEYTVFNEKNQPVFPGYIYENGVSIYRGEEVGEGGYVYSEPNMYANVALLDIASMHPSSIIAEQLFGEEYTYKFEEIKNARIAIKHKDYDKARNMLGGALEKYLTDETQASNLAKALKIVINSIYGLTSAKFVNRFKDLRNTDNIVAKRGALFMVNLKHEVQKRGYTVAHIKTDSIKIPNATKEIIDFVMEYGKLYGYIFEHEATYDRMALINKSVYVAKYLSKDECNRLYGYIPGDNDSHENQWVAVGTEFQVPYIFKTLFSHELISFEDMCETREVKEGDLYLDMNENLPDVTLAEKTRDKYLKAKEPVPDDILEEISKGHNYIFVGRVGQFCPMKDGANGGVLYRCKDGKYYAVSGTKGFRWLESEVVKELDLQDKIDRTYYDVLVDEAVEEIRKLDPDNFDWFMSDNQFVPTVTLESDPLPF